MCTVEEKVQAIKDWCENVAHMECRPDQIGNPDYHSRSNNVHMLFYLEGRENPFVLFTPGYDDDGESLFLESEDVHDFLTRCTVRLMHAVISE